ncbi:MAG: DNA replication/repair protein RecF, partial [Alphaproteobacteria bacterium]
RQGWAVAARVHGLEGLVDIGTGFSGESETAGRSVRIDGSPVRGTGALGAHMRVLWLIPAMDGLFTGPASERRSFLDRLVQSLAPAHRDTLSRFERAMRQRNRLLEAGGASASEFDGLEMQMAESGVAIAAARREIVARLGSGQQGGSAADPFPWATLALEGRLETLLEREAAVDAEDAYRELLARGRARDAAARRTLEGPHRSDLIVGHGPKRMAARVCSTGEQKALLTGLVLAHARLVREQSGGCAPVLLLDEVAAHLDAARRQALFEAVVALEAQAWMSGTDPELFRSLEGQARFLTVKNGGVCG